MQSSLQFNHLNRIRDEKSADSRILWSAEWIFVKQLMLKAKIRKKFMYCNMGQKKVWNHIRNVPPLWFRDIFIGEVTCFSDQNSCNIQKLQTQFQKVLGQIVILHLEWKHVLRVICFGQGRQYCFCWKKLELSTNYYQS